MELSSTARTSRDPRACEASTVGVTTQNAPADFARKGAAGFECLATSNEFAFAMVTTHTRINNPKTAAVARHILLSIFLETDGFQRAACRFSRLPEATAPAMMYALRSHWLELRGNGVCLTPAGRRLAIQRPISGLSRCDPHGNLRQSIAGATLPGRTFLSQILKKWLPFLSSTEAGCLPGRH